MVKITSDQQRIKDLIETADADGLRNVLKESPAWANEGLPYDEENTTLAHPLHRICDAAYSQKITGEQGVELAAVFLQAGADINGGALHKNKDTPLVAASSLLADDLALYYMQQGANIFHPGCYGGTALHWASWCGRDVVVKKLIEQGAEINKLCEEFKSTPLFWAVHGWRFGEGKSRYHQPECVKLLLAAGADKTVPNLNGYKPIDILSEEDDELKALLS